MRIPDGQQASRRPAPLRLIFLFFAFLLAVSPSFGQVAALQGVVIDQSGAVVVGATVTLTGPSGLTQSTKSGKDGAYQFSGLKADVYVVQASAPNLALLEPAKISLISGAQTLNLQLNVVLASQRVEVQGTEGPVVSTAAGSNASALVLKGNDLQALSDDPEDLATDLQALAGPSAGPNGGSIYIDGFSSGEMPSKDAIREIRINQNPFSPEYDKLGYGRIEIFTKPGADRFHGTGSFNFGDSFWNSRNPYAAEKAPFLLKEYTGSLTGPLNQKTSFFFNVAREAIDNGAIINGTTLDPLTLEIIDPYTQVNATPQRRLALSPRLDRQLGAKDTLSVRFIFATADIRHEGVGGFNLVSNGLHNHSDSETVQIANTVLFSANAINETRALFYRFNLSSLAEEPPPTIEVLGSFIGGGAPGGHSFRVNNAFEGQNYTSLLRGPHTWRFGVRLRYGFLHDTSPVNFGGTFIFSGLLAPELDASNQPVLGANGQPVLANINSIESYRRTLLFGQMGYTSAEIRALGGRASQFTIATGTPSISVGQWDLGAFASDDWRARPGLTLSYGLRYEAQTNLSDWRAFAPRIGLAWAPRRQVGKSGPKNVIRAGFGVYYDRFDIVNTLAADLYNGIVQQQYVITNPDFYPAIPSPAALTADAGQQVIERVSPTLRAPYVLQSALAFERQLPAHTTMAVTFADSHGLHQLRSQDINAPLPGSYNPQIPGSGVFPLGNPNPVFQMESAGLYNQTQLITNFNSQAGKHLSLFGSYLYNHARSNTDGIGTFPANPYSMAGEYGPAATDIRHQVTFGGSISTRWGFRFNPFLVANSGAPFDLTTGQDLYGDTLFNGRPGLAVDPNQPGLIPTAYGLLDPNPSAGERILPRNYGRGPGIVMFNLRLSKSFAFWGAERGGGGASPGGYGRRGPSGPFDLGGPRGDSSSSGHRYNLTISMAMRNLLNRNNPGPIIGNIESPQFGQANQPYGIGTLGGTGFSESADNRRLELQTRFTF
ncbi:MAG TPA: carboxypeptidase regulatory-like domain-containing protein [Terriglobia bacterium]|nr:carboxypeptidase regulatory-like domain-containing protein [Terriglobia bacterium]